MYTSSKKIIYTILYSFSPRIAELFMTHKIVVKYIISGGLAAVLNLALLYTLTEYMGILYLYSSVIAYVVGTMFAFTLQKFWTFRDRHLESLRRQFMSYGIIAGMNFFLNPAILAFFVEVLQVWYMISQLIAMAFLAIISFTLNKTITFRNREQENL